MDTAKQVFDLVTHIFILFPIVILFRFTDLNTKLPFSTDENVVLLYLTLMLLLISFCHHLFPNELWLEAVDEGFVGINILYVFFVYIDEIHWGWTAAAAVLHIVFIILDAVYSTPLAIIATGIWTFIAITVFMCKHKNPKSMYLLSALLFAILAAVMFLDNIREEDFFKHSLWHLFAFVSFGYLVMYAVTSKPVTSKPDGKKPETMVTSKPDGKKIEAMKELAARGIQYMLSLSVRVLVIALYSYAVSLESIPVGWSVFAIAYGTFFLPLCFFKSWRSGFKSCRMVMHSLFWLAAGVCLYFELAWATIILIVSDFLYSLVYKREDIMKYWKAILNVQEDIQREMSQGNDKLRYRDNILRF